jgi:hypothetical protein
MLTQTIEIESNNLPPFDLVELKVPAILSLSFSQGMNEIVFITPPIFQQILTADIYRGKLEINTTKKFEDSRMSDFQIEIKVSKSIKGLSVIGSGRIYANDFATTCKKLTAQVYGSGKISLSVRDSNELHADVLGSGSLIIDGNVKSFIGSVTGSGDLNIKNLTCQTAELNVHGSGLIWSRIDA